MNLIPHLLYRDGLMLVLNKPSGLPVHGGVGGGQNLEQFFDSLRFGLPNAPALAHRLDRDTSGCLILGRHHKALRKLGKLMMESRIQKRYWAVVVGVPPAAEGVINQPLAKKSSKTYQWWMEISPDGQPSCTEYTLLETLDNYSLVEFRPRTGRTHQIRVHSAFIGCPLLNDAAYGGALASQAIPNDPFYLHAVGLTIPLYPNRDAPVIVEAPFPDRWQTLGFKTVPRFIEMLSEPIQN
jgi:RluA family pseudouridine synthase